jgi:hypothetical protein
MMEEGLQELALNRSKQSVIISIMPVHDHEDDDDFMGVVAKTHSFLFFFFQKSHFYYQKQIKR